MTYLVLMDGYESTRRIKALPGMARTTIIAVSSFAMKGDEAVHSAEFLKGNERDRAFCVGAGAGYEVIEAATGAEGIAKAETERPDSSPPESCASRPPAYAVRRNTRAWRDPRGREGRRREP